MYSVEDKIKAVSAWAEDDGNEEFDCSFINSLEAQLESEGSLSDSQEAALDNIIDKWGIDLAHYI